ncbi:MAG TPA: protein-glutamate O-methyltransferase CheR [Thermoanaerobaculia bacterium]|nr:protein-glutamate O-methyltransferase CheR [Thermoanaerobaculia bacterium]
MSATPASGSAILEEALAILRERRNVDFAAYRRPTIERRFANRIICSATTEEAYLRHLREDDREVDDLLAHLTIKVSRFYRNGAVFDSLRGQIIPRLRAAFGDGPLRAWSAGCARGEEAYTLAMLFEQPGDAIFATDIDERALAGARAGIYPASAFTDAPTALVNEFTNPTDDGDRRSVSDALRGRVQFSRHDVAAELSPAGAPYHLVSCRNVLMYFARPLQARLMRQLAERVMPGGFLVLGEAEWPTPDARLEAVDRRQRIFRRIDEEVAR